MIRKIISIILFISNATWAQTPCEQNVLHLAEGEVTPCEGYLFSPEMEFKVRIQDKTYKDLELLSKKQDDLIKIMDERLMLAHKQNKNLVEAMQTQQDYKFWQNALYFILGAAVTGFVAGQAAGAVR